MSELSQTDKEQLIRALRRNQINTIADLRRIESMFAAIGTPDVTEPMTLAWTNYVNSNNLLTEMRGLTRNYPFSSHCIDEAKRRVYSDPSSNRSWNLCWLVLTKIQSDNLIPYYANWEASQSRMWGKRKPSDEAVAQLASAMVAEWNWALDQMLSHWYSEPCR
ncbi:hypothetical protein K402DRAFT_461601 [Aulographum hederae CBS 113979]|uniref:Uncharacterized protein n=1 Tax=Aulographum hederae CBS 113979 TaxID=1176131 RepID=A0A6G1H862_9PEZI|nr:hypothetical protein K402DRAFT_461601 [Aulographum hederae CBS 113979]